MKNLSAVFAIVNEKNCPLYKKGELLHLSEKTLACPKDKEMCLILVRDLTELLFKFLQDRSNNLQNYAETVFNCSGCNGLIKFSLLSPDKAEEIIGSENNKEAVSHIVSAALKLGDEAVDCPLLQVVPPNQVKNVLSQFKEIVLEEGAVLIHQGEYNHNLYIVFDGELTVESSGVYLDTLVAGEICGEMSYLGADTAVSSVKAVRKTRVMAIAGDVFGQLLGNNQQVQSYMAQLLACRLRKTTAARSRDFASCMSGRIAEIVPAELFQIFHMHQKTGVLSLELAGGMAKVSFREGCIINATYNQLNNEEAIFKILAEKKGLYRFTTGLSPSEMKAAEIGDFMMLLMEGVKRVDEEQERRSGETTSD